MKPLRQIFIFSILKTFTKVIFPTFCFLSITLQSLGQISENFDDDDLSDHPVWSGDVDDFNTEEGWLRLSAEPVGGSSSISTPFTLQNDVIWECFVRLDFNPSSSNFVRIYLFSDTARLDAELNGYYVQAGGSSDEISLFRQEGSRHTKIIDGRDGILNLPSSEFEIKVTRSSSGKWKLSSAFAGDYQLEGETEDATFHGGGFTGLSCVYTSTRADKFSFDHLRVYPSLDDTPPALSRYSMSDSRNLLLVFDDQLDKASSEEISTYRFTNPSLAVLTAKLLPGETTVQLSLTSSLSHRVSEMLTMSGIRDSDGNVMNDTTIQIVYSPEVAISYKDVVISEFLADPSPLIGLPESEFVEIHNRTNEPVNLINWSISDGNSVGKVTTDITISPGGYAVLAPAGAVPEFDGINNVAGVQNFPSLNNSGDFILLFSERNTLIDSIAFDVSWYRTSDSSNGGRSLEIIDPDNACGTRTNWAESEDDSGGTPGKTNSINAENLDLTPPSLRYAYASSAETILLVFDEALSKSLSEASEFKLSGSAKVLEIEVSPAREEVTLHLDSPIAEEPEITLSFPPLFDCAGNGMTTNTNVAVFRLSEPDSSDVVINEVLFNPRSGGSDFVEVFNRSTRHLDLTGWAFANFEGETPSNIKKLQGKYLFLKPGAYVAFAENRNAVLQHFPKSPPSNLISSALPALNDDSGSIALLTSDGEVMDFFPYHDKMHSPFLKDAEGVSLERIAPNYSTLSAENWKSAAATHDYGTPGLPNSNAVSPEGVENGVTVVPVVFIPQFGQPDFTRIEYAFNQGNLIGTVKIFDQMGRVVQVLAENALLGTSGFFRWDGQRIDGTSAGVGNYLVQFQVLDSSGSARQILKRVAIAAQF